MSAHDAPPTSAAGGSTVRLDQSEAWPRGAKPIALLSRTVGSIVGRDAELRLIGDRLAADPPVSVVLAGRAGVGKSRVAAEVAQRLSASGRPVRRLAVTEALATIPFGTFAELLPAGVPVSSRRLELFRAVRAGVARLGPAPVLVIDDGHLLDDGSAALVHQLASEQSATVLLTQRSGTTPSDAVSRLWTDGLAERVELQSLTRVEVGDLVASLLEGSVGEDTVARLADASDGNVLFLLELVQLGQEQRMLEYQHGAWHWTGEIVPSGRLADLIGQALSRAEPDVRGVLEIVALSEPVGSELIARIVGEPTLDCALESRFLTNELDGVRSTLGLAHPLFAEALRRAMKPTRRQALSRQLASALRTTERRRRSDRIRLPEWLLDGGIADQRDADLLAGAAWETYGSAPKLAERFARAAIEGGAGFEAVLALAAATNFQGRFEDSVRIGAPLLDRASTDLERRMVGYYVGTTLALLRRTDEAEAFVSRAEEACTDTGLRLYLTATRADVLVRSSRLDAGLVLAEQVMSDPAAEDGARMQATAIAGRALTLSGKVRPALTLFERALPKALAQIGPDTVPGLLPATAAAIVAGHLQALEHAGRLVEIESFVEGIERFGEATDNFEMRAAACFLGGPVMLRKGRPHSAARLLRRYFRIIGHAAPNDVAAACTLAEACALAGDHEAAVEAERMLCARSTTDQTDDAEIARARAWVAVAAGEFSRAASLLENAVETARRAGLVLYEAAALHDLLRVTGTGNPERLAKLAADADGAAWVDAYAAAAAAKGDATKWEETAKAFSSIGASLHAAEAWAAAAAAYERAGLRAKTTRANTQVTLFVAQCEGARTPALRAATFSSPFPLTLRETEIVELAARGHSNRDIAARLFVSVRTVEGHLSRAYAKLGTSDRGELASLLGMGETSPSSF